MQADAPRKLRWSLGSASVDARLAGHRHVVAEAARRPKGGLMARAASTPEGPGFVSAARESPRGLRSDQASFVDMSTPAPRVAVPIKGVS